MARLFFILPLIGVALTCVEFGISLQYSAVLMSILLALGVIVVYRGKRMTATRTELSMAARIQESMLPSAFPDRKAFDLFASMDLAREVGGDFLRLFSDRRRSPGAADRGRIRQGRARRADDDVREDTPPLSRLPGRYAGADHGGCQQ